MVAGELGVKRNELMSGRYPIVAGKSLKTREQVKSELRAPSAKANWSLWAKTAASSTKSILTAITQRTMQQLPPTRTNRQRPLASDAVTSYRQGRRSSKPWRNFK